MVCRHHADCLPCAAVAEMLQNHQLRLVGGDYATCRHRIFFVLFILYVGMKVVKNNWDKSDDDKR